MPCAASGSRLSALRAPAGMTGECAYCRPSSSWTVNGPLVQLSPTVWADTGVQIVAG